jgi:5'-3' exonuclease
MAQVGPLMLLDTAALYYRAFYGVPDTLTAPDGTPVNAIRGLLDMIARLVRARPPGALVACLDADWRPAFRVAALPSYKAHRVAEEIPEGADVEEVPDTLTPQVPIIREVLAAFGIATAEAAGYEADDVIGTLTATEDRAPVEVITGDRDLFQVIREEPTRAVVIYVGKGWAKAETLGTVELAERYALPATHPGPAYADMSVLRGDPSDGLPGVAGIGEKTAAKLITQFGSLTGVLQAAIDKDKRLPAKTISTLEEAAAYLAAAPGVVNVVTDAPIVLDRPDDLLPIEPVDPDRLAELRDRWGLGTSIERLTKALANNPNRV